MNKRIITDIDAYVMHAGLGFKKDQVADTQRIAWDPLSHATLFQCRPW
ncbi:hypothetical protein ROD_16431 [Citrobacter rodentium ICC168]|uniref:Uncharacterized protein n=1 Tax=Citrobacter rodentium (strain ICC168) TaxID=637910 RepID=D2TK66_CITRI|nr:hypothetical protein ROD_16431 [Citrobacter rodentium ICC168]